MPLTIGTRLGPYEIVSPLGAGGMGEVYRARDTRLGRDVAIKVLPELFAADLERFARFEREARLLASLKHPNIAAIYGLEEANGVRALVLELVEGPTLAELIAGTAAAFGLQASGQQRSHAVSERLAGPEPGAKSPKPASALALDEALPIARQIAQALEAAHKRGIIHRDLKPANIVLNNNIGPLFRVAAAGGTCSPVTSLDTKAGETQHVMPLFLPESSSRSMMAVNWCVVFMRQFYRGVHRAGGVTHILRPPARDRVTWSKRTRHDDEPGAATTSRSDLSRGAGAARR